MRNKKKSKRGKEAGGKSKGGEGRPRRERVRGKAGGERARADSHQ